MESDDETNQTAPFPQLSTKDQFDDLNNSNDCLTDAFIRIYQTSLWWITLFFKSLYQILSFPKEEFYHDSKNTMHIRDILSMNNSADEKIYRKLPRHRSSTVQTSKRLPNSHSQRRRERVPSKFDALSNQTRVTVRSMSNQNVNHAYSTKEQSPSNTLGTINSHITVAPVESSRCQTDSNRVENGNLREQLADALCRRSCEPLAFVTRGMCCGYCRPMFFPSMPCCHSGYCLPPPTPQPEPNQQKEFLQKSEPFPSIEDGTESQSSHYSVSPMIQSQSVQSPIGGTLSNDTTPHSHMTTEQNHSVLSFPEHDISPSQESEKLIHDNSQLKQKAETIVEDSIQTAREKYQKMRQMNDDHDTLNNIVPTEKQIVRNKSKSALLASDHHTLCEELCSKLNLSDSHQIAEIMRILASNAPDILKEPPPTGTPSKNKESNNTLCGQLLLHPPFKPKRLINLCPDGTIQVLSAVDEHSKGKQIDTEQQYQLNYSNSALRPAIENLQNFTNESSLTVVDMGTNLNHMLITESTSTQQSQSTNEILLDRLIVDNNAILSIQQKKTLREYRTPSRLPEHEQSDENHSKAIASNNDENQIVEIDLDLNDETIDDQNSLPEIIFKRIIVPEHPGNDEKVARRRIHRKSRHHRSRSHFNKKIVQTES